MRVNEVMSKGVEWIHADSRLNEAAAKMKSFNVGLLPVCEGDKVVGMVTDRDITVRAVADGKNPRTAPVRDVMTVGVVYCYEDHLIMQAVQLMRQHQVRRLVVLDCDQHLAGIVTLGDLAAGTGDDGLVGSTLDVVRQSNRQHHQV